MPIDRAETQKLFSYYPEELHENSAKHVAYTCDTCGILKTKQRRRVAETNLCHKCAIKKPRSAEAITKFHNTMLERYGTTRALCNVTILQKMHDRNVERWGVKSPTQVPEIMDPLKKFYVLDPALKIHDAATKERYGYWATEISPSSDQHVLFECVNCLGIYKRVRKNITPNPFCQKCSSRETWRTKGSVAIERRNNTVKQIYGKTGYINTTHIYGLTEARIAQLLQTYAPSVKTQIPLDNGKRLDIVLPEYNLAIEYNGLRWHHEKSATQRTRWYHYEKMQAAQRQGLRLITIFEDEWRARRHQILAILRNFLNVNQTVIAARNCTVCELTSETAQNFIDENHLQPITNGITKAWGLYYLDKLYGVLTLRHDFRSPHVTLSRLCFMRDIRVVGGANKLFKPAVQWACAQGYSKILTWSDNRWFSGDVYRKLGFTLDREGTPDYAYVNIQQPRWRIPKETQQKSRTHCPPGKTEVEWAFERGYARIWDCGHKRWELKL